MTARIIFFVNPSEIDMLKATSKKEMWIPAYTKHDGTFVAAHYAHVNVSDDHDDHKVLSGNGSATQKDAHKLLSKHGWFNEMPDEHKVPVLLKHATELQDAAGIRARAAKFRVAILSGAVPIPSQTKAYLQLDAEKQAKYKAEFEKSGKLDLFNQAIAASANAPDEPGEEPQKPAQAAAAPAPEANEPEAPASAPEPVQAPEPKQEVAPEPTPAQQATPKSDEAKEKAEELTAMVADLKALDGNEAYDKISDAIGHDASMFLYGVAQANDDWIKDGQAAWDALTPEQKAASLPLLESSIKHDAEYDAKHAEKLTDDKLGKVAQKISILNGLKKQWTVSDVMKGTIDSFVDEGEFDDLKEYADVLEKKEKHGAAAYAKQKLAEAEAGKEEPAKPEAPAIPASIKDFNNKEVAKLWKKMAETGDSNALVQSVGKLATSMSEKPSLAADEDIGKLLMYGKTLVDHMGVSAEAKPEAPKAGPVKPQVDQWHADLADQLETAFKDGNKEHLEWYAKFMSDGTETGDDKKLVDYAKDALASLDGKAADAPAADDGPKEGDTKVIDGVTYVLKGGRWHKVGGDETASDAVGMPVFGGKTVEYYSKVAQKLKALFDKGDWDGIQKMMDGDGKTWSGSSPNSKLLIQYGKELLSAHGAQGSAAPAEQPAAAPTPAPVDVNAMPEPHAELDKEKFADALGTIQKWAKDGDHEELTGYAESAKESPWPGVPELGKYADTLAAWVKKGGKAPEPKAPAAPAPEASSHKPESIDHWHQTGGQKGSNAGGEFTDEHGQKWYCKFPASESHTKNEMLAAKLYEAAGIEVPHLKLISQEGKVGIASKIIDGVKKDSSALAAGAPGVADGFAVDAWLANWDVVGTGYDNMQIKPNGHAVRLDVGGSLLYRAQGTPKGADFGNTVGELKTLKDGTNGYAAHAFGKLTDAQIAESAKKVAAVSVDTIADLVVKYGPGSTAEKADLANKLAARRLDVIKQAEALAPKQAPKIVAAAEKAAEAAPAPEPAAAPAPVAAPEAAKGDWPDIPQFTSAKGHLWAGVAQKLMDQAKANGHLKGLHKYMSASGKHIFYAPSQYYPDKMVKVASAFDSSNPEADPGKMLGFWKQLEAAAGAAPKKKAAPKIVSATQTSAAPAAAQAAPAKPDLRKLKVDAEQLPHLFDFQGANGGKGLSSKTHVNAANQKDQKDIFEFAKQGDLLALQKYQYEAFDKETGASIGLKPISEHPSGHVKEFWSACCATLELVAYPPAPLKAFDEHISDDIKALSDAFQPHAYGKSVHHVPANEKLGFWIALGIEKGWEKFKPKETKQAALSPEFSVAGKKAYEKYNDNVKHFIKSVQKTGQYNNAYREGKDLDMHGWDARAILHDLYQTAAPKPAGTTITKWIEMPQDMVEQFLASPQGLVFQNPGSMCCSMSGGGTSHFGPIEMTMHYAPGAVGVDTFGSGGYAGEMEITTLPGQRFMVLNRGMKGGKFKLEVLMLPPDQTYVDTIKK